MIAKIGQIAPSLAHRVRAAQGETISLALLKELSRARPSEAARILAQEASNFTPKNRAAAFYQLARHWSSQDPEAAFDWATSQSDLIPTELHDGVAAYVAANYSKVDPSKALQLMQSIGDRSILEMTRHEIAQAWAKEDHASALAWLDALSPDEMPQETKQRYRKAMLVNLSAAKPLEAAAIVAQMTSPKLQEELASHVAAQLSQVDLTSALSWIETLPNPEASLAGLSEIVYLHAHEQPHQLLEHLLKSAAPLSPGKQRLIASALQTLAFKDSHYAIELLDQMPETQQAAYSASVTNGLLAQDSSSAIQWIRSLSPGPIKDGAASILATEQPTEDPIGSIEWANQVSDPTQRNQLLRAITLAADVEQLPELKAALQASPLQDTQRELLLNIADDRIANEYAPFLIP